MRSERQVLQTLTDWATDWENIRAVVLNGSRADQTRSPDEFSDYDLAILVRDLGPTQEDSWLRVFGEIMVRWPLGPQPTFAPDWITQLVLFKDGVRIDFQFTEASVDTRVERAGEYFCVVVDKDRLTDGLTPEPPDGQVINPPTEFEFADRINAFWWDIPYVAKALRRGELDFAKFMLDGNIRYSKLHPLIRWYIGTRRGWDIDLGIYGRWFDRFLDDATWQHYLQTFGGADFNDNWRAMFATLSFVDRIGRGIARDFGFSYPDEVAENVTQYIRSLTPNGEGDNLVPGHR